MSKEKFVGMLLPDVQKAFDSVNHTPDYIHKTRAMGINPNWFRSYLSNR